MKRLALLLASLMLALPLSACGSVAGENLLASVSVKKGNFKLTDEQADAVAKFSLELTRRAVTSGESTLISPLSVLYALGMTTNGAAGETLAQLEDSFGLSAQSLNEALSAIAQNELGEEAKSANSIWFKESQFTPYESFLEQCATYYDAGVFAEPFDDSTLKAINNWVSENTDGLIDKMLDEISKDSVMYLINAIAFEATWQKVYEDEQVEEGTFTAADGSEQSVDFMYSGEYNYLSGEGYTGFMKLYEGGNYGFVALLPDEGSSPAELLSSLDAAALRAQIVSPTGTYVETAIPKFEGETFLELNPVLKDMGITDAFDVDLADFSNMGESVDNYNINISRVLHKTYISVDQSGTRAGAATVIDIAVGAALIEDPLSVICDRPFVYMIVDTSTGLPLFIGTVESVN